MKRLIIVVLLSTAALVCAQTAGPKTFATPEEAKDALLQAADAGVDALKALFGPDSEGMVRTGDDVADRNSLESFKRLAAEKVKLEPDETDPNEVTLLMGNIEWPFPLPLVRKNGKWYFDAKEGKAEIRRRTVGRNELDAIEVCHGYVEAQKIYAETDWNNNGFHEYARKIISSEGKKDGLYWPGGDSPVAEGFAKAVAEGYRAGATPKPYHGYFYKILLKQGPDAPGGAQDYVVQKWMIGGFALVAWPAEYGLSGYKTFIVNHEGIVYQKDLGTQTSTIAKAMTTFNPDKSWEIVETDDDQP